MRRKLILSIMILFVSFVMVGCDWFGNNDTTTTVSTTTQNATTSSTTTTTNSNMTYYTVIFKDYDGTNLKTQSVAEHSAATPPVDPVRTDEGYFSYTFNGWDQDFSDVQANMTVYATYTQTYNSTTTFSHELLFNLVKGMMNDEDLVTDQQVEDQIDWLLDITNAFNEHQLYDMMMTTSQMMDDLQEVSSADELGTWILSVKTSMLDKDTLVDALYAILVQKVNYNIQEQDHYLNELTDILDENDEYIQSKAQILADVQAYLADNGGDYQEIAQQYFDTRSGIDDLELAYDYVICFQETPEGFDWDTYYILEDLQDNYLQEYYFYQSYGRADDFLTQYNEAYDALSPQEQAMYDPFLNAFIEWKIVENTFSHDTLMDIVYDDLYDAEASDIVTHIEDWYSQYHHINNYIRDNYDFIASELGRDYQTEMETLEAGLNALEITYDYLVTTDGESQIKALMSQIYDDIVSIGSTIDEDTFQMIMGLVDEEFDPNSLLDITNTEVYPQIVEMASKFDQIFNIMGLDVTDMVDTYLEVYFEITYASSYDEQDLADVQSGWEAFIDDTLTQITTIGAMDPDNLSGDDMIAIAELQQRITYLENLFIYPEEILNGFMTP